MRYVPVLLVMSAAPWAGLAQDLPKVQSAEPKRDWNARFTGQEGWIGGDGAASVVLGPERILWLFGDSLLGKVKDGKRDGATMVNNTLGIQRGKEIRFLAGKKENGKPAAFFL